MYHLHCLAVMCLAVHYPREREADPARQATDQTTGEGSPCPHLLPDGAHAGHPLRIPPVQALPVSGMLRLNLLTAHQTLWPEFSTVDYLQIN